MLPLPDHPHRVLVIASGQTPQEVTRALTAFCLLTFPYPDAPQCLIQDIEIPTLPPYARPGIIYPGQTLSFRELGLRTQNFEGMHGEADLRFSVPPDLYAPMDPAFKIKLRFAYGAKMRPDSVLNVLLNGRFQTAIALDSEDGAHFRDYSLSIPLSSLKPGPNTLTFKPALVPLITGRCTLMNIQNLWLTLFEDSVLVMPEAAHLTTLPDLRLFGLTGFPYTVSPYGGDIDVLVTEANAQTFAAAWTLLAKIAQIHEMPFLEAAYHTGEVDLSKMRDALIIGPVEGIPSSLMARKSIDLGPLTRMPHSVNAVTREIEGLGWIDTVRKYFNDVFPSGPHVTEPSTTWIKSAEADLGSQGLMFQDRSPSGESTVTVITAAEPAVLQEQINALVHPAMWSRLSDDLVVWRGDEYLATQKVGPYYTVGRVSPTLSISYALSRHPWLWVPILGIPALLLALLTLRFLTLFRRRRHPDVPQEHDNV